VNNLNSVLVEGNLVADPELRYTSSGTPVCSFTIGVNRSWKDGDQWKDEASYFDITAWNRQGEVCKEHLTKGQSVRVAGRLKQDRWEQEGQKRSKVIIVAEHVEFGKKPKAAENQDK